MKRLLIALFILSCATIAIGATLTVHEGSSLTVYEGSSLTVYGEAEEEEAVVECTIDANILLEYDGDHSEGTTTACADGGEDTVAATTSGANVSTSTSGIAYNAKNNYASFDFPSTLPAQGTIWWQHTISNLGDVDLGTVQLFEVFYNWQNELRIYYLGSNDILYTVWEGSGGTTESVYQANVDTYDQMYLCSYAWDVSGNEHKLGCVTCTDEDTCNAHSYADTDSDTLDAMSTYPSSFILGEKETNLGVAERVEMHRFQVFDTYGAANPF